MIFLPKWFPLNVYDFACWARQTVVALSVVLALRPVRPLPFTLDRTRRAGAVGAASWPTSVFGRALVALDKVLKVYQQRPLAPLRRVALSRAERWIVDRQEADGGWGGIQPPWVYSLIALHLLGYPLDHPVMRRGLAGMQSFTIDEDPAARRGLPVSGLGHVPLADRAARRRCSGQPRGGAARRPTGCSISRSSSAATGRCAGRSLSRAAGRSSSPTPTTPTSTTPPRSSLRCNTVDHPDPARVEEAIEARRALARRDAQLRWRLGRLRRRQLPHADP